MEKITVIVFMGKGHGEPDALILRSFDCIENANDFIAENTNSESKYWKVAEIVKELEPIVIPSNY